MNPARLALSRAVNRAIAEGAEPIAERRACRLEGWSHGHLNGYTSQDSQGFYAVSNCGAVKIRLSAATVARKYEGESCPSIYYEG